MSFKSRPKKSTAPRDEVAIPEEEVEDDGVEVEDPDGEAVVVDADNDVLGDHRRFVMSKNHNKRIDKYLQTRLKKASRHQIQKLINGGGVTVNDKIAKCSTKIHLDDVIDVYLPPPQVSFLQAEDIPIHVLYEDDYFIIVNKQANLIVHPARSAQSGTLLNGLAYHFKQKGEHVDTRKHKDQNSQGVVDGLSKVGKEECRPGIVHRLDKNTTGVMVVAKSDEAHWKIAKQFELRQTLKAYLALVHGCPDEVGGLIEEPLGKHPTIKEAHAVRRDRFGKNSVTLFRVRERYKGYSLVELELKTGRTHQIRVHLSYMGYPIVGDIIYGGEPVGMKELEEPVIPSGHRRYMTFARTKEEGLKIEEKAKAREDMIMRTPALHATLLEFTHPITKERVRFTAPLHNPYAELIGRLQKLKEDGPVCKEGYFVDLDTAKEKCLAEYE